MSTASTVEITATVFQSPRPDEGARSPFNESPGREEPEGNRDAGAQRSRSSANVTTSATSRTCVSVIGRKRHTSPTWLKRPRGSTTESERNNRRSVVVLALEYAQPTSP